METTDQKTNTLAFVTELKIRNQLDKLDQEQDEFVPSPADEKMRQAASELVSPFDWFLQPGEIRLLAQTEKLTYGVILPWDWSRMLLIPFSHASHPATDQEMYASHGEERGAFQQVYQLWNARTVNRTVLGQSWLMGKVAEEDMARLNRFLRHIWLGEKLEGGLQSLTGLPLRKGCDIRKAYLDEELANFDELDRMDAKAEWAETELESRKVCSRFEKLSSKAELQAASGRNVLSEAYVLTQRGLRFLQGIEVTDFEKVGKGSPLPHFCWETETLPRLKPGIFQVLFRHRKTGKILGTGPILEQDRGHEIILVNPIDPEDVPALNSPSDIQLIICK